MKSSQIPFFETAIAFLILLKTSITPVLVEAQNHPENQGIVGCRGNLKIIDDALQRYRVEHRDFPPLLSDLSIKQELWCPEAIRRGQTSPGIVGRPEFDDRLSSYFYEFALVELPSSFPGEPVRTNRDFKRRQMGLVGSNVPIVRCFLHGEDRALNLSFGGEVFESPMEWEKKFDEMVRREDLMSGLFKTEHRVVLITFRDSGAPPDTIDLTSHYNASLVTPWLKMDARAVLNPPMGLNLFKDVRFDVRGIVQLVSSAMPSGFYPAEIRGIQVGQHCGSLHFLHGASDPAAPGTRLGSYLIHYEDQQVQEVPIIYGVQVLSWVGQADEGFEGPDSVLAWERRHDVPRPGGTIRLYKTHWRNPRPGTLVRSIDFISAVTNSAPFLVAITAQALPEEDGN
jgi:hypothetical protein